MVRIGVIGVGGMGQNHARIYHELGVLTGVMDTNPVQAKKIADRYQTQAFTNHTELLKNVDAVSIATPTVTHYKIGMEVIKAGKDLLIEKPLALKLEEAEMLVNAAEKKGVILAVGHIERYNPVVEAVKSAIDAKRFGNVIAMAARRVSAYPPRIKDVGVILDLATHDIDIVTYLANSDVRTVYTVASHTHATAFEDHVNLLLTHKNGVTSFIEANWLTPMKVRRLSLTCSKNFVEIDYITQTIQISSSQLLNIDVTNLYQIPQEYDIQIISVLKQEPLRKELEDFLRAVEKRCAPLVTGHEGLKTMRIAYAAMSSAAENKVVNL